MKAIEAATCVDAWLQACQYLMTQEADGWRAYNVILEIADPLALPPADRAAFGILDRFLSGRGGLPVNTVVNTIFPAQLYQKHGAIGVYDRYMSEVYPQVKKHPDCSWGTYAQRIICRTDAQGDAIYPLRDLVAKVKTQTGLVGPNRAVYELGIVEQLLEIPIYNPQEDRSRPLGGRCLSHVSVKAVKKHGLTPLARILGGATAGVPPRIMGIGPAPASQKLLARLGLSTDDLDVFELNEAFAAQGLASLRMLGIADDDTRVNRNGGAIALGHPLGMSGARITGTAALELRETGARFALATMCIGVGQGIAIALERV